MVLEDALDALQDLPTPKAISPKTHAFLDYATIGGFLLGSALLWKRSRAAAGVALANGLFTLGYTLFTDYPGFNGSIKPMIPFPVHGQLDIVQAAMATVLPAVFGIGGEAEAKFFYAQAANETLVISTTDFYLRRPEDRLRAAA